VFPDHAYPFASLLNVIALHIGDVPSGVRDEALVVVTAVENGLATPGHVDRRRLLTGLTVSVGAVLHGAAIRPLTCVAATGSRLRPCIVRRAGSPPLPSPDLLRGCRVRAEPARSVGVCYRSGTVPPSV
jgi:hypothetical protein